MFRMNLTLQDTSRSSKMGIFLKGASTKQIINKFFKVLMEVKWDTVFATLLGYIGGSIGLYHCVTGQWRIWTYLWSKYWAEFIFGMAIN